MTTYAQRKAHRAEYNAKRAKEHRMERIIQAHQHMRAFERACADTGEYDASISYIPATGRYRITGLRVGPKVVVTVCAKGLDNMTTLLYAAQHESQMADPEGHGL